MCWDAEIDAETLARAREAARLVVITRLPVVPVDPVPHPLVIGVHVLAPQGLHRQARAPVGVPGRLAHAQPEQGPDPMGQGQQRVRMSHHLGRHVCV